MKEQKIIELLNEAARLVEAGRMDEAIILTESALERMKGGSGAVAFDSGGSNPGGPGQPGHP